MTLSFAITMIAGCIMVLGISGMAMGLGYLVITREKQKMETEGQFKQMSVRDMFIGWSCTIAGVGVTLMGFAVYTVLTQLFIKLENIFALLTTIMAR